jgi:DNA-binding response OmpR family regulator
MNESIRILIVEDDESIREALHDFMESEGYSCRVAVDGLEAIELLEKKEFDPTLILLDLNMPRLSGKEFVFEREKRGLVPDANIVMLSATPEVQSFPGIATWIRKPVDLDDLENAISTFGGSTPQAPLEMI